MTLVLTSHSTLHCYINKPYIRNCAYQKLWCNKAPLLCSSKVYTNHLLIWRHCEPSRQVHAGVDMTVWDMSFVLSTAVITCLLMICTYKTVASNTLLTHHVERTWVCIVFFYAPCGPHLAMFAFLNEKHHGHETSCECNTSCVLYIAELRRWARNL